MPQPEVREGRKWALNKEVSNGTRARYSRMAASAKKFLEWDEFRRAEVVAVGAARRDSDLLHCIAYCQKRAATFDLWIHPAAFERKKKKYPGLALAKDQKPPQTIRYDAKRHWVARDRNGLYEAEEVEEMEEEADETNPEG